MRRLFALTPVMLAGILLCGCASTSRDSLAELLRDLEELQTMQSPAVAGGETAPLRGNAGPRHVVSEASAPDAPRTMDEIPAASPVQPSVTAPGAKAESSPLSELPANGSEEEVEIPDVPDPGLPELPGLEDGGLSGVLTIQPDCLVQVSVEEDPSLDGSYPVNGIGAIQLGYVGPVILYNKTEDGAAGKIAEVLRGRHFKNATVSVRILRASYDRVQVVGGVNSAGLVKIGAGDAIALTDLLLRAGGVKPGMRRPTARVVQGGLLSPMVASLPGEEHVLVDDQGMPAIPNVYLRNNDLVHVHEGWAAGGSQGTAVAGGKGEREILVLGEVKRPGIYRFSGGEPCTLLHLIFKMGGLPPYANTKSIRVMRMDEDGYEIEHRLDARSVLQEGDPRDDFELMNGDRVVVPARRISLF